MVSTKILNSRTVFTIENKCFLSTKSAYKNDFWKIIWQMKTGVMAAENVFKIETSYFAIAFHNNTVFALFLSENCSLELKRILSRICKKSYWFYTFER